MRTALTIGLGAGLLAATLSLVAARSQPPQPVAPADLRPLDEILVTASQMGLVPAGKPLRRGLYYVFHAYDGRGAEVRVVVDAQLGDVLSVVPAGPIALVSPKDRPPRIIHVPQPGESNASVPDRDEPEADSDADEVDAAPPRRVLPKARSYQETPAAPRRDLSKAEADRRTMLDAPPPSPNSLTPIYPTPRFSEKPEAAEAPTSGESKPDTP
jgi:hypothetical protein